MRDEGDGLQFAISAAFSLQTPKVFLDVRNMQHRAYKKAFFKGFEAARDEILTILKNEQKRRLDSQLRIERETPET